MASIDAPTPQLKAIKKWLDALTSLDISKVEPLISWTFKYQSFPMICPNRRRGRTSSGSGLYGIGLDD
jgi:hypothetical protein